MYHDILLIASSAEGNITAWDVQTGTALTTFKNNASPINAFTLLGNDYFISSQLEKPCLHFWTWHKDQVHQRSFPPEQLISLASTIDGTYCAAGGISGAVHLWETSTGRLLRSWLAHYKKINCLAFSPRGTELITGGEDTLVMAWLLPEVLDGSTTGDGTAAVVQQLGGSTVPHLHAWSEHTMPVTGIAVGKSTSMPIVVSCSLDRTIKIRCLGTGSMLRSCVVSSSLTCVVLDPAEHAVYAGSQHGVIYGVSLVHAAAPHHISLQQRHDGDCSFIFEGHAQSVTSLSLTSDAMHLVSGSEDGSVRVWDLQSMQTVRVFNEPVKGPVSAVVVMEKPAYMAVGGKSSGGKKGPGRMQPLAQFSKYAGGTGSIKAWEGPLVLLDGQFGGDVLITNEKIDGRHPCL